MTHHAFARLARAKGVFSLVVLVFGLAFGAVVCAAVFAHVVIKQPLPYPEQARLIVAEQVIADQGDVVQSRDFSYPALDWVYRSAKDVFSSALMIDYARDLLVSHPAQPLISVTYVSPEYATLFAPPMSLGGFPAARREVNDVRPVAVISHSAWQSLFGKRDDVLGLSVRIASGKDFEIVGVTSAEFVEPEFQGPDQHTAVWLPWDYNPSPSAWGWSATTGTLVLAGRLRNDVSAAQAAERLSLLLNEQWQKEIGTTAGSSGARSSRIELTEARRALSGAGEYAGPLLLIATLGLALITLVNVTHYLVAWVTERSREFSIRLALGGRRRHLFRLLLAEMLSLTLPAGAVALLAAAAGLTLMQRYLGSLLPRLQELSINGWTIVLTIAAAVALAIILASVALLSTGALATNRELVAGRRATASKASLRIRTVLMASQVAVACLLVAVSLGLYREAHRVLSEEAISLDRSSSVFLYQKPTASQQPSSLAQQLGELRRQMEDLPGVEAISQSHSPLQDFIKTTVGSGQSGAQHPVELKRIDDRYLGITHHRLASGRNISREDVQQGAGVALVNNAFARILQRQGNVLGTQLFRSTDSAYTVIGVVDDLSYPGSSAATPRVYFPVSPMGSSFIIKWRPDFRMSREQLVTFLASVNPDLGVFLYDDLEQQRADILLPQKIIALSTMLVALLVMLVSAMGLYGMVRYTTQLVRAEIGTRLAFGARRQHILLLLLGTHSAALALGFALTAAVAFLALPRLGASLFEVSLLDASLAAVALAVLAALACFLSARPLLLQSPAGLLAARPT